MNQKLLYHLSTMLGEFFLYTSSGVIQMPKYAKTLFVPSVANLVKEISSEMDIALSPEDFITFATLHLLEFIKEAQENLMEEPYASAQENLTEKGKLFFDRVRIIDFDTDLWNTAFEDNSDG